MQNMMIKVIYCLSLIVLLTHTILADPQKNEDVEMLEPSRGFQKAAEQNEQAGRSVFFDSIFNVSSTSYFLSIFIYNTIFIIMKFLYYFGVFAGGILVTEKFLNAFCSLNLGVFLFNEPQKPKLPIITK